MFVRNSLLARTKLLKEKTCLMFVRNSLLARTKL